MANAEKLRCPFDLALDLVAPDALSAQGEGDIVPHGQMRIEPIALEHHGDAASAWRHLVDGFAIDEDVTRSLLLEPGDDAKQRRLAAPGRAEQNQDLAIVGGQRDAVDRSDRSELFSDCACRDRSHVDLPYAWAM